MICVRCEIARAKIRAIISRELGYSLSEIVCDLNSRYAGTYALSGQAIVRFPTAESMESTHIFGSLTEPE